MRFRPYLFLLLPVPGFGQDAAPADQQPADLSIHARWGVGLQVLPVAGASVRLNLSRRLALQGAALPPRVVGSGFRGMAGGRLLFKPLVHPRYNLFLGLAAAAVFEKRLDDRYEFETVAHQVMAVTLGAESLLGTRLGLSGELGAFHLRDAGDATLDTTMPTVGVGLHYYFR